MIAYCLGTISVGGAHIKPTKPLPQDLQKFLDESPNGVIYFSLGTIIQSSKLSEHQKQAFLGNINKILPFACLRMTKNFKF